MKKNYISPRSQAIKLQMEQPLLSASPADTGSIDTIEPENEVDAGASYSMKREDLWDNQW